GQGPHLRDARLNLANDVLVQPAGAFLAVARDEGNGVALIEQLDHTLHLQAADLQILSDARAVQVLNAFRHLVWLHSQALKRPCGHTRSCIGRLVPNQGHRWPTLARARMTVKSAIPPCLCSPHRTARAPQRAWPPNIQGYRGGTPLVLASAGVSELDRRRSLAGELFARPLCCRSDLPPTPRAREDAVMDERFQRLQEIV